MLFNLSLGLFKADRVGILNIGKPILLDTVEVGFYVIFTGYDGAMTG